MMYPAVEVLFGVLLWYCYYRFGLTWSFALSAIMIFVAVGAAFADLFSALDTDNFECGIIPDTFIVIGLIGGFCTSYMVHGDILFPLYGAIGGFAGLWIPSVLYKLIRKRDGMGFGDIKLIAVFGAFLGLKSVFALVFLSAIMGAVIGITWQALSSKKDGAIPFGPFISTAAVIYLFFESAINSVLYGI
jgi:leader peptidase (prepilin peptidase)/N-methyltransferase